MQTRKSGVFILLVSGNSELLPPFWFIGLKSEISSTKKETHLAHPPSQIFYGLRHKIPYCSCVTMTLRHKVLRVSLDVIFRLQNAYAQLFTQALDQKYFAGQAGLCFPWEPMLNSALLGGAAGCPYSSPASCSA